jgi:hypothetical protein
MRREDHSAFVKQLLDSGAITRHETVEVDGGPQDLYLGTDRYDAEVACLEGLGAHKLRFSNDRGSACWTMSDIEANEFCVH